MATSGTQPDLIQGGRVGQQARNIIAKGTTRFTTDELQPQPLWQVLSDRVITVLALNPSPYTLNGTNTYLIGTGPTRILLDTGELGKAAEYVQLVDDCMKDNGVQGLSCIILTHFHHDHTGGLPALLAKYGPVPVRKYDFGYAATGTRPADPDWLVNQVAARASGQFSGMFLEELQWFVDNDWSPIADGEVIETQGATLRAFHTPGHAHDHIVLWLDEEQAIFTGDNVLGWGTTYVGDLWSYMRSLTKMHALNPSRLYPAHGPVIEDGTGTIARYISHRSDRERVVVELLQFLQDEPGKGHDVPSITALLYPDIPKANVALAATNVAKILLKLECDGVVAGAWPANGFGYSGSEESGDGFGTQDPSVPREQFFRLWKWHAPKSSL